MSGMTVRIQLQNLSKRLGRHSILENLCLDVAAGEFLVVLGASGCGKSTLLNTIAGLERADSGSILIDGVDVTNLDPGKRNVAMAFQTFALYPTMTARENIGFALKVSGHAGKAIASKVAEIAELLKIQDLLDRRPSQLSGGQQQRVAIGRALARDPNALLLDEPLSNLDARMRAELKAELKRLHGKFPRTTSYVTHDQLEAMSLATRIAILDRGTVQQLDTPQVVYQSPANMSVANLVGSPPMQFVEGVLDIVGGCPAVITAGKQVLPLPGLQISDTHDLNIPVSVGIRPEQIGLCAANSTGSVACVVQSMEMAGADTYVRVRAGAATLTVRTHSGQVATLSRPLAVRVDGNAISVFATPAGRRINRPHVAQRFSFRRLQHSAHVEAN
jgi:multiple sugar transport system ATP-binding protein